MMSRAQRPRPASLLPLVPLLVALLAVVLTLGTVLRAYALPVEARTVDTWFAYQSSVGFDFTAQVKRSTFYTGTLLRPDDLIRVRMPVEPPAYRRVLISKFTEFVDVRIPYRLSVDRDAMVKAVLRVEGALSLPGVWQKPYPLLDRKELRMTGRDIAGAETFRIPVAQMLADMEANRTQHGISMEPMELKIRPVLDVTVDGLHQPVQFANAGEFQIVLRSGTVELDDVREVRLDKALTDTRVTATTFPIFGREVPVTVMRQISVVALSVFALLALLLGLFRQRKPDTKALLQKLGPNLIVARSFEIPGDSAVSDVWTAKEMLQLHQQTERPVIRVGDTYYLVDGTSCYRLKGSE